MAMIAGTAYCMRRSRILLSPSSVGAVPAVAIFVLLGLWFIDNLYFKYKWGISRNYTSAAASLVSVR